MKLHSTGGRTEADLGKEVLLFNNVLSEICDGFTVPDFEASVGSTESHVRDLFGRLRTLGTVRPLCIQLVDQDLLILQNALLETLRALGVEEFSIRTGLPFEFGQAVLRELHAWNSR